MGCGASFARVAPAPHEDIRAPTARQPEAAATSGTVANEEVAVQGEEQQTKSTLVRPPHIELIGDPLAKPGGSGARVYRCSLEGATGTFAVKLLPHSARPDQVAVLSAEVELCRALEFPSIVRYVHLSTDVSISGAPHCAIVMDLLPVSLEDIISYRAASSQKRHFAAARLTTLARELASALCYLHCLNPPVLHRDVKPSNVFFEEGALAADADERQPCLSPLRLGDFDVSCRSDVPVEEFTGTPSVTMPPEMFKFEGYHTPADIWAFGMTLQWCLMLMDPFGETTLTELEACIVSLPPKLPIFTETGSGDVDAPWPESLEPLASIARMCCCAEPQKRLLAQGLIDEVDTLLITSTPP